MQHKTPPNLAQNGRKLWKSVTNDYELGEHELTILLEAARTADALETLESIVREEGVTVTTPQGVKAHPALVEARQQRLTLTKLVSALRIPLDEEEPAAPKQRGTVVRGLKAVR